MLEPWDDKACEVWEPPEENYLNCDACLQAEPVFQDQESKLRDLVAVGFHRAEAFMKCFEPFLVQAHDNDHIDFDTLLHPQLKDPTTVLHLVLSRFQNQIDEFEEFLPEIKDLGLLRIDFLAIKQALLPNPKKAFDTLRTSMPPVVRKRIDANSEWF